MLKKSIARAQTMLRVSYKTTGLRKFGSTLRQNCGEQKWLERVSLESIVKPPYVGGSAVIYHIDGIDATKGTAATWPASSIIDA